MAATNPPPELKTPTPQRLAVYFGGIHSPKTKAAVGAVPANHKSPQIILKTPIRNVWRYTKNGLRQPRPLARASPVSHLGAAPSQERVSQANHWYNKSLSKVLTSGRYVISAQKPANPHDTAVRDGVGAAGPLVPHELFCPHIADRAPHACGHVRNETAGGATAIYRADFHKFVPEKHL